MRNYERSAVKVVDRALPTGTPTVRVKSGYGIWVFTDEQAEGYRMASGYHPIGALHLIFNP